MTKYQLFLLSAFCVLGFRPNAHPRRLWILPENCTLLLKKLDETQTTVFFVQVAKSSVEADEIAAKAQQLGNEHLTRLVGPGSHNFRDAMGMKGEPSIGPRNDDTQLEPPSPKTVENYIRAKGKSETATQTDKDLLAIQETIESFRQGDSIKERMLVDLDNLHIMIRDHQENAKKLRHLHKNGRLELAVYDYLKRNEEDFKQRIRALTNNSSERLVVTIPYYDHFTGRHVMETKRYSKISQLLTDINNARVAALEMQKLRRLEKSYARMHYSLQHLVNTFLSLERVKDFVQNPTLKQAALERLKPVYDPLAPKAPTPTDEVRVVMRALNFADTFKDESNIHPSDELLKNAYKYNSRERRHLFTKQFYTKSAALLAFGLSAYAIYNDVSDQIEEKLDVLEVDDNEYWINEWVEADSLEDLHARRARFIKTVSARDRKLLEENEKLPPEKRNPKHTKELLMAESLARYRFILSQVANSPKLDPAVLYTLASSEFWRWTGEEIFAQIKTPVEIARTREASKLTPTDPPKTSEDIVNELLIKSMKTTSEHVAAYDALEEKNANKTELHGAVIDYIKKLTNIEHSLHQELGKHSINTQNAEETKAYNWIVKCIEAVQEQKQSALSQAKKFNTTAKDLAELFEADEIKAAQAEVQPKPQPEQKPEPQPKKESEQPSK